jgi:hypothetical protein
MAGPHMTERNLRDMNRECHCDREPLPYEANKKRINELVIRQRGAT